MLNAPRSTKKEPVCWNLIYIQGRCEQTFLFYNMHQVSGTMLVTLKAFPHLMYTNSYSNSHKKFLWPKDEG